MDDEIIIDPWPQWAKWMFWAGAILFCVVAWWKFIEAVIFIRGIFG